MALRPPGLAQIVVQMGVGGGMLQCIGIAGGGFVKVAPRASNKAEVVMHVRVVAARRQGVAEMHLRRDMIALREGGPSTLHRGFDVDVHGGVLPVACWRVQLAIKMGSPAVRKSQEIRRMWAPNTNATRLTFGCYVPVEPGRGATGSHRNNALKCWRSAIAAHQD